jgi:hypothetical protein
MADQALTRAAALNAKPAVVLAPDVSVNVATINVLPADDRVAKVQDIITNVTDSVLARSTWAITNKEGLCLSDLEAVIDELQTCGILRILRRVNSNAQQDRIINGLSDDIISLHFQLVTVIRNKERGIHADSMARLGAGGVGVNHGAPGGHGSRPKPARERLRPGTGVTEYTGPDGGIHINDFLIAAQDLFNAADEGTTEKLTHRDKIVQLRTLITGPARDTLRLECTNTENNAYDFTADILDRCDITVVWRDITIHAPQDFSDFLRFIFTSRSDSDVKKEEYKALVMRGYFADPDTIRRMLQRARIAVGAARPDIAISQEQLLQDFLSMLPTEHCTKVYESPEYTATGGAGITIDVAARVAQNYHRAIMRTTTTGARQRPAARLATMQQLLPGNQEPNNEPDMLARLETAIQALNHLQAQGGVADDGEDRDSDSVNAVAMVAAHNATIYSLAQRQYNAKRRQDIKGDNDNDNNKQMRIRCWQCGQLGHVQAHCSNPSPKPGFTPFRRIRHRDRNPGYGGAARQVRFFRRNPNTHRLTAIQDNEIANQDDYVYALDVEDDESQVFVLA